MTPQLMIQPSVLIQSGMEVVPVGDFMVFRFTPELQQRSDELIQRAKESQLTPDEEAEMAGISELSRIFTFINAQLSASATWSPSKLDDWYNNEPNTSVNIATPPNT
ncbi:hypothetical protein QGP82_24335 [Leptothoe sp. LEGE 181152]|nr:hypothetical protein [Leptothoe sp. LEGE 181152]